MMGILAMTLTGSITGVAIMTVLHDQQAVLLLNMILAYLIGGLAGFGLAVLLGPATRRFHTEP